jgi:flagellar hook-basal body complex protein FliE
MTPITPIGIGLSPVAANPIPTDAFTAAPAAPSEGPASTMQSFSDLLGQAIDDINGTQAQADAAATALVTGQSTDIHTVMIDMEKAKTTFDLAVQVRNTSLNAYNDLMRTQF